MEKRIFQKFQTSAKPVDYVSVHLDAYERFLQRKSPPAKRKKMGLELLFQETLPIKSYDGTVSLEFVHYEIGEPRYNVEECRDLKRTYGAPLRARLRLNKPDPIEETVYLGEIPLMIGGGEFVINGVERIVVSQLHRSPGIDFREEKVGEQKVYTASIIPERGSWIEVMISKKGVMYVKVDQGSKFPVSMFLRAMDEGLSTNAQIISTFYNTEVVHISKDTDKLQGKYLAEDIVDPLDSKVVYKAGEKILENTVKFLMESNIKTLKIIPEILNFTILNTLEDDPTKSHEEALQKIYAKFRPGMPIQLERARTLFFERFFDKTRYQLGRVGRFRINRKLGLDISESEQTLHKEDVISTIKYLLKTIQGEGGIDDIDDLGNRRVRTIDELATEEMRKGFFRMKRSITEQISVSLEPEVTPRTLVNSRMLSSIIDHFFERNELSQVVDQTNPIAQLTHERRLSALGPGGLNRKRAGFEVRDVHISHYGRICPIETPEGANIGLITSLAIYAGIDEYGFLVSPYRKMVRGKTTDEIQYLRADQEKDKVIAPADIKKDKIGRVEGEKVLARVNGEYHFVLPEQIEYMDLFPQQIVGVTASLIPFMEHDDANRVLMGANMQRQAVPLLISEAPLVSTGTEKYVAQNSSMTLKCEKEGVVTKVTADEVVVSTENEEGETDIKTYRLRKYAGLTERTCFNQKAIVKEGEKVKKNMIIADGPGFAQGELALGKNVLVAFLPWEGYNFEDAIVISERLIKDDVFTSIHIEDFEVELRETKLGKEEFTRDIPNVSEKALKNLDERGIIQVGTKVKGGDVLVGKISPKSKSELTPEEKLLHAIFGKAGEDVKNESLTVSPGTDGVVIDTKHFARRLGFTGKPKEKSDIDKQIKKIEKECFEQIELNLDANVRPIEKTVGKRLLPRPITFGPRGTIKDISDLKSKLDIKDIEVASRKDKDMSEAKLRRLISICEALENEKDNHVNRLVRGDDLPTGVLEMVKVRIATKRIMSVGDKIAGRHGNKGVISKILPEEDMPYMEDGTPVDIVLNPLGVPSRMNVGQILETHIGWAARKLGIRVETPVLNGATETDINSLLSEANLPKDGKVTLYDGRTGESFNDKITVGYAYIMKLNHLVDDKIHARATGPYSLITQQPLGGKARFGGQRFGEMEVWALEAYGAAHTLQEMLTVKSDDVDGRTKIYESIIKGTNTLDPNVPISFEVLINEIRGLCLNLKLEKKQKASRLIK